MTSSQKLFDKGIWHNHEKNELHRTKEALQKECVMKAKWLYKSWLTYVLATCTPGVAIAQIHGAGATFPAPLYVEWAKAYAQTGGEVVRYDAVGSGLGIEKIRRRDIDFGASDVPLTTADLTASGLMQFPAVIGGVVPIINISGIKAGALRLSGPLLAEIYLGRIRKWSDPKIAELNPKLHLPDVNITVVHRSDSSGSSLLWTDYLSHTSSAWQASIGTSLLPAWPIGVGGIGNEGVASYVQRTRFAIGYVEYTYARSHNLSDVSLRNRDGNFVRAQPTAFRAAAEVFDWSDLAHIRQLDTDQPGTNSWPITAATFILIPTASADSTRTRDVLKFFDWALHQAAVITNSLDYEPIPNSAVAQMSDFWRREIRDSNGNPIWP